MVLELRLSFDWFKCCTSLRLAVLSLRTMRSRYTESTKEVKVFEARCPRSEVCDNGRWRLLYKKKTEEEAVHALARNHFCNEEKHPELKGVDWDELLELAKTGVNESVREHTEWVDNEDVALRELVTSRKRQSAGDDYHREEEGPKGASKGRRWGMSVQARGSLEDDRRDEGCVTISVSELDDFVEGIQDAASAAAHAAEFCEKAAKYFNDEANVLLATKENIERVVVRR